MNLEDKVWAIDPKNGFTLGVLKDIGVNAATVVVNGKKEKFDYSHVYPSEKDLNRSVDDNCALMYLNVANLLNNCRNRYLKETIYTYVANILVAINPYKMKPELYNSATIKKYKGKSLGTLPPHCYAIADKAYRDMKTFSQSQSMVVSGESGAGKTENTKFTTLVFSHITTWIPAAYTSIQLAYDWRFEKGSLNLKKTHDGEAGDPALDTAEIAVDQVRDGDLEHEDYQAAIEALPAQTQMTQGMRRSKKKLMPAIDTRPDRRRRVTWHSSIDSEEAAWICTRTKEEQPS